MHLHPSPRRAIAAAIFKGQFHLFGGLGALNGTSKPDDVGDDLWRISEMGNWEKVHIEGLSPPGLRYPSMGSSPDDLFLFGGCGGDGHGNKVFNNEVWRFDGAWHKVEPSGSKCPHQRYLSAFAVFDDKLVAYGGAYQSPPPERQNTYFGDLWVLDIGTNRWTQVSNGENGPGPRYASGYVQSSNQLFILGGYNGEREVNDLWVLDLMTMTWDQIDGETPLPAYCPALGDVDGALVLAAGRGHDAPDDWQDKTWVSKKNSGKWETLLTPTPPLRAKCGYASDGNSLWVFGGETPEGLTNELWQFHDNEWTLQKSVDG